MLNVWLHALEVKLLLSRLQHCAVKILVFHLSLPNYMVLLSQSVQPEVSMHATVSVLPLYSHLDAHDHAENSSLVHMVLIIIP